MRSTYLCKHYLTQFSFEFLCCLCVQVTGSSACAWDFVKVCHLVCIVGSQHQTHQLLAILVHSHMSHAQTAIEISFIALSMLTGADNKSVSYYATCISDMFTWNNESQSAAGNKEGMVCPGLLINRPATVTNTSVAYYNNIVLSDPSVYSYQGCSCAAPLVGKYYVDASTGEMLLAYSI